MAKYDSITFTNIDTENFAHKWDGEVYTIKAGKTKTFPSFLAKHLAKHLITKILMKDDKDYSNENEERIELQKKILGDVMLDKIAKDTRSDGEKLKDEVEQMQTTVKEETTGRTAKEEEIYQKRIKALEKARQAKKAK